MARSTSIWVVHNSFGQIVATFTVKHEMVSWLNMLSSTDGWIAVRWRDGHPRQQYPAKAFNVSELTR